MASMFQVKNKQTTKQQQKQNQTRIFLSERNIHKAQNTSIKILIVHFADFVHENKTREEILLLFSEDLLDLIHQTVQ